MSNIIHSEHVNLGVINLASEIRERPDLFPHCAEVYEHLHKRLSTPQKDTGNPVESVIVRPDAIALVVDAGKQDINKAVSMLCNIGLLAWVRPKPKIGLRSVQLPKKKIAKKTKPTNKIAG